MKGGGFPGLSSCPFLLHVPRGAWRRSWGPGWVPAGLSPYGAVPPLGPHLPNQRWKRGGLLPGGCLGRAGDAPNTWPCPLLTAPGTFVASLPYGQGRGWRSWWGRSLRIAQMPETASFRGTGGGIPVLRSQPGGDLGTSARRAGDAPRFGGQGAGGGLTGVTGGTLGELLLLGVPWGCPRPIKGGGAACPHRGAGWEGVKAGEGKQECCGAWVADKPNNCF